MTIKTILEAKTIFWDFDGVIKDSVSVKADAFEQLFSPYGIELAKKVRKHHEKNGGVSRYEKIPIYLSWASVKLSSIKIEDYEKKFSFLVKKKVIDSPWVKGAYEYLHNNYLKQLFFLVTATPQKEIEEILRELNIYHLFKKIIGSPVKKEESIKNLLKEFDVDRKRAIMIGDSLTDYEASQKNNVKFILHRTNLNKELQNELKCHMIESI